MQLSLIAKLKDNYLIPYVSKLQEKEGNPKISIT